MSAGIYGLFPVCVCVKVQSGISARRVEARSGITFSLGSHQIYLGEKSVQVLQAEKQWESENKQESAREIKGAESLQMSREQLRGGTESRKPGFTGGRKRKSAETCAKFLAAQEAADSPLN